jgi:N6-L-threonylcarbamoyladenine synthase
MKILAIETSCDETSIALIEKIYDGSYKIISHETISQMKLHREYGGVYPTLSRREHEKNLVPLLHKVLNDGGMIKEKNITQGGRDEILNLLGENIELLERYPDLKENVFTFFETFDIVPPSFIAVTNGPGLPPALWVGVNFAKVLSKLFGDVYMYPINHMEGHIVGALSEISTKDNSVSISKVEYPVLNLLISGGHTELVLSSKESEYLKIGETQDDAVGESFDKVARLLGLPYPGGPEIGKLAKYGRENGFLEKNKTIFPKSGFPRPMYHSHDLNFSFSGLKTHILYFVQDYLKEKNLETLDEDIKISIATEFEEVVVDVLSKKVRDAIVQTGAKTLVVGGGVASSPYIREKLHKLCTEEKIACYISSKDLATDNALMIALTCANRIENGFEPKKDFLAVGSKNYIWE